LDPNELLVSRPSSALSAASDVTEDSSPDPDADECEWMPPVLVRAAMRGHKGACLLCSSTADVLLHRVVNHHEEDAISTDVRKWRCLPWLKGLGLIEQDYTRDDYANIMTLCRPHTAAFDAGVWRWVPSCEERARMRQA
ncbi:hypothetical protein BV20DRAFT_905373, partial [Pilatotrama ljubarskyi]